MSDAPAGAKVADSGDKFLDPFLQVPLSANRIHDSRPWRSSGPLAFSAPHASTKETGAPPRVLAGKRRGLD